MRAALAPARPLVGKTAAVRMSARAGRTRLGYYVGSSGEAGLERGRTGVLLVNLGTPRAPTYSAVRRYLAEFLSDRRVIELSPWLWRPVLYGPVLTFRPRRSAEAYREIWMAEGSPLLVYSRRLEDKLKRSLGVRCGDRVRVALAMTYGEPSVARVLDELLRAGVARLVVLPLFPQYSGTTTGAVFDAVARALTRRRRVPALRFIADYHDDAGYVAALADAVSACWTEAGRRSHLLLSYHGIPVRYVEQGDPYRVQALETSKLLASQLGLAPGEWSVSFQSRFGPVKWLEPYTDRALDDLLARGVREVTVISPSFAVDCLETLEEVGMGYREQFLAGGGQRFTLVPALNDTEAHATALEAVLLRESGGWLAP